MERLRNAGQPTRVKQALHPGYKLTTPYSLLSILYSLLSTLYSLFPIRHSPLGIRYSLPGGPMSEYDVIVVGAGNAAFCAALAAQEQGASVLMLEAAPEQESGGNRRLTAR